MSVNEPVKKLQKIDKEGSDYTAPAVATEEAIHELTEGHGRDTVKHFSGLK